MSKHAAEEAGRTYRFEGTGVKTAASIAFAAGVAGLALGGGGAIMSPALRPEFYFAYHTAFIFCLSIMLGGLFLTIVSHLCKYRAFTVLRRVAESVAMNAALMAVMFIPVVLWLPQVFIWAEYEQIEAAKSGAPQHHAALISSPAFAQEHVTQGHDAHENGDEPARKPGMTISNDAPAAAPVTDDTVHANEAESEVTPTDPKLDHAAVSSHAATSGHAAAAHDTPHAEAHSKFNAHLLEWKSPYLNRQFFIARAVFYFLVWMLMAGYFYRASVKQDATGDPEVNVRLRARAAPAVLVFALTGTFAFFDWTMGLDYGFFSTIWGLYHFGGCMLAVVSFIILIACGLGKSPGMKGAITVEHFHDLGKWLLTFTIFWSYVAFSQYMLIWYANLPEETEWFQARTMGAWQGAGLTLLFGHFMLPFLLLLPRWFKRAVPLLAGMAIYILCIHYVDLHWIIMPALRPDNAGVSIIDIAVWIGLLGVFTGVTLLRLSRAPLAPVGDPYLEDSLNFENM